VGPFSIQRVRLNLHREKLTPFTVEKDTLVAVTDGTLYTTIAGEAEYAEAKGAVRHLRPGDRVHFRSRKACFDMFFEYAEFLLISGG
jgi:hypothetical protein